MPKTKLQKKEIVKNLAEKIKKSKVIVFAEYQGLGVKEMTDLRKKLLKENSEFRVVKNTLLNRAFKESKKEDLDKIEFLTSPGTKAVAFGYEDEVNAVKNVYLFSRINKALKLKGGILEDKVLDNKEILTLALLPTKQELKAKVVGQIGAPIYGFVNVLSGNLRNLVYVLQEISKTRK